MATDQTARFVKDPNSATVYDTAGGFLDPIASAEDFAKRAGTTDIAGNTLVVPNVNQYLQGVFQKQAQNRFLPQQDLALQGIQQSGAKLDQNAADVNRQYDTLGQQLVDAANQARGSLTESANNYGLLSSGLTAAGLGKISSDLSKNQGNAAQDRASQLASIALQRAGLATQEASVKQQTSQSINDYVNQLLSGSTQAQEAAFNKQLQLQQLAASIPKGQSITIQGQTIQGTAEPKLSQIDLGNKVVSVDSNGNVVASYAKGLTPSVSSSGSSLSTAQGKVAALQDAVQQAIASGGYSYSGEKGKKTREQLIGELAGEFAGSGITSQQIKDAVYGTFRGASEGAYVPSNGSTGQATVDQSHAAGFAARMQQAGSTLDSLTPKVTSMNQLSYGVQRNLPSFAQSSTIQQEMQAEQNFINAILRRESGAAISQSEYDNAAKQYFVQPGDSAQVIAQKKANRDLATQSLIQQAGSAWKAPSVSAPTSSSSPSISNYLNSLGF